MALAQVGNAADTADTAVARTIRRRELVVARPTDDVLLDAIRRALVPGDPVARLLANWPAQPAAAISVVPAPRRASPTNGTLVG